MAEPAVIEASEGRSEVRSPVVESAYAEPATTDVPPSELFPERRAPAPGAAVTGAGVAPAMAEPRPEPAAPQAGMAPAARAAGAMQARFGNVATARMLAEPPRPAAGTRAVPPTPTETPPAAAPPMPVVAEPAPVTAPAPAAAQTAAGIPAAPAIPAPAPPAAPATATTEAAPAAAPGPAERAAPAVAAPAAAAPTAAPAAGAPGAPGAPAAPAPPPALDTTSTEAMVVSLASFPPSALGTAVSQASAELPGLQAKEKEELKKEMPVIDRPTGMPARPEAPAVAPTELGIPAPAEGPAPGQREGEPPPLAGQVAVGPVPGATVSTVAPEPPEETTDDDSWWSSLWGRIRSFLESLPEEDPNVSTSAGARPKVDLTGDADPSTAEKKKGETDVQVQDARAKSDAATRADFGENDIAPILPERQRLRPGYEPAPPPGAPAAGRPTPAVDPEVQAAFDQQAAAKVAEAAAQQRAQEDTDREEYRRKSEEVRAEGERQIDEETRKSRAEQIGMRNAARADVQAQREAWQAENEAAGKAYSEKAEKERLATKQGIDEKAKGAEKDADDKLTAAEREADETKRRKEAEAAAKKREAESKPRSWWQRVKGAVADAFSALKRAVTKIFNELRSLVKGIIDKVRSVVRGLIELARRAIVGLIKAFGAALKLAVSIALIAFPGAARKARALIDRGVNGAVNAVNKVADALKAACDKILDWVAAGLDFALGLLQKAVLFYIQIYETLVNLLMDVLEGIYNLVQSAREMPDKFLGQMSEEVLGMDLTAPMPFERSAQPDTTQAAQAAVEGGAIDHADARVVTKSELSPEQIQVDQPPPVEELHPDLLQQFGPQEGKAVEFGERSGPEFTVGALQDAALGGAPAAGAPAVTNETPAAGPKETPEERAERELQEFMKQERPSGCEKPATEEPAGPGQIPEAMKIGPLSAGQRGRYLLHQMIKGIKEWFACNWGKLLAAAVGVLLGAILLNVLTGGAILAALPLIMQVVSAFMLAQTVARVTSYFGDYLVEGWDGRLVSAGKALARAIAIAAVEIVFALLFNLGSVIKALKGGLKGAAVAAARAAKATIVSGVKAVGSLAKLGVQAAKTALKNGRLILAGLRSGIARGARSIKDFVQRLWKAVRFKKFKIVFSRGWFRLLAWVNPWIVVMEGKLKGTLQEIDDAEALGKQIGKDVKASTFKTVEGKSVKGKLVSATDDIPTDYRKTMEIFTGKNLDDYVVHHMIEQQTRKMTKLVDDILLHSPVNLKLIPKGQINAVVHLSRIRRMWNALYRGIEFLPENAKLAALRRFEQYTDEFITEMLKFAEKRGSKLTRAALEAKAEPWVELGKLADVVDDAVEVGKSVAKSSAKAVK